MTTGSIVRLVNTHGSLWGTIRPQGTMRSVFFNPDSLVEPLDFALLADGQDVEFEEADDRVNGKRALKMVLVGGAARAASAP